MNCRNSTAFSLFLLFLISALLMLRQLVTDGYFSVIINDTFTYTSWAWQFTEALKEGVIYPRWTALNFWGYGSPTFILYPPLAYYPTAFLSFLTDSIIVSMNIVKFIVLFLSATGMFFLVREFYSERIALFTASLYAMIPYTVLALYLVGTYASVVSLVWFSPIVLFTYRYIKNRRFSDILYAGACYGGLILTHLINAYMFTFVITAFIIYMSIALKKPGALIAIPLIIIIGGLISAAYIFPLLYEKQFVNLKAFIGEGAGFHFADFFLMPDLTSKQPPDFFWRVYYDTFRIHVLLLFIFIVLFLLQRLKVKHNKTREAVNISNTFFLYVSLFSLFLLFGPSSFLWETIPFFKYIQFPVRWLNITVFAVVFLSASAFRITESADKTGKRYLLFAVLFLTCLLLDYKYIRYAHIFPQQELIPAKGESYTSEHLPVGIDIDKVAREGSSKERVIVIKGKGEPKNVEWKSEERIIRISAETPLTLRIKTFYFPGWTAAVDGTRMDIKTGEGSGAMLIDVPEGKHTLVLRFVDTPVRYYSKLISLTAFLSMVFGVLFSKKKDKTG